MPRHMPRAQHMQESYAGILDDVAVRAMVAQARTYLSVCMQRLAQENKVFLANEKKGRNQSAVIFYRDPAFDMPVSEGLIASPVYALRRGCGAAIREFWNMTSVASKNITDIEKDLRKGACPGYAIDTAYTA